MEWVVLLQDDFKAWLLEQESGVRKAIFSHIGLLKEFGANLGRPYVDTVKSSKLPNLKELRVQVKGEPWRVLFAFDPKRQAILLIGGNKQGDKPWYKQAIPLAEKRYKQHLDDIGEEL